MQRLSVQRQAIDELLSDGEWHFLDEIMRVVCPVVPAFVAERVCYATRSSNRREATSSDAVDHWTKDPVIVGRKVVVYRTLYTALRHGKVERDGRMYRSTTAVVKEDQ